MKTLDNLKRIKNSLKEIRENADEGDNEAAHAREDSLHYAVLIDVAGDQYTREELRQFAKEALKTEKIGFERWYA